MKIIELFEYVLGGVVAVVTLPLFLLGGLRGFSEIRRYLRLKAM